MAAVVLVAGLALSLPCLHVVDQLIADSYMILYCGRWVAAHGIPHAEVLTVAAAHRPWIDQQWLTGLIDFEAWRIGGYGTVALLSATVTAAGFAILALVMLRRGASVILTVACCALAVTMALSDLEIHAETFGFPLFAIGLAVCLRDAAAGRTMPRTTLLLLPLLVIWANLHGTVLIAVALAGSFLLTRVAGFVRSRDWRQAGAYIGLSAAVVGSPLATPYGLQIVSYYSDLLGNPAVGAAAPGNRPLDLSDPTSILFLAPLALILITAPLRWRRRQAPSPALLASAAGTAVMTLLASRSIVWFAICGTALLAETSRGLVPTRPPSPRFLLALGGVGCGLVVLAGASLLGRGQAEFESYTPLGAVNAAARYALRHPGAKILGDLPAASALLWHYPQLEGRVGYDARLEHYPPNALYRWIRFERGVGASWPATTRGYGILLGSTLTDPALAHRLLSMPGVVRLAEDRSGVAVQLVQRASRDARQTR